MDGRRGGRDPATNGRAGGGWGGGGGGGVGGLEVTLEAFLDGELEEVDFLVGFDQRAGGI
ncbi:MAG: hypothetical protein RI897_4515 [Verrucomicrobiota bacterium]